MAVDSQTNLYGSNLPTLLLFMMHCLSSFKGWCAILAIGLLVACGEQAASSYTVDDQQFIMEGPLFTGPNTAQATFAPSIEAEGEMVGATLTAATLTAPAGQTFDAFSDIVLQLVTGTSDMIQVGVLNPVPKGQSEISLQVSSEADLTELLGADQCVWVIDANIPTDMMDTTLQFSGNFRFELTHSK
jgi:hypothetical protein